MKVPVVTAKAPAALGPYSQAVSLAGLVFCSGQLGLDPQTGELAGPDVASQARQALKNLKEVLAAAGSGLDQVVKTTIFLADLKDFGTVNAIYGDFFPEPYPARSTVQVAGLPKQGLVEIEVIAALKK